MEGGPAVVRSEQPGRDRERYCDEGHAEQKEGGEFEGQKERGPQERKVGGLGLRSQGRAGEEWREASRVCAWQRSERGRSTSRHARCTNYVFSAASPMKRPAPTCHRTCRGPWQDVLYPAVSIGMKRRRYRTALLHDIFSYFPWTRTLTLYLLIIPSARNIFSVANL